MSEQADIFVEKENDTTPEPRTPLATGSEQRGPLPAASDVALEDILPINARLFSEHRWHEYFARLRAEDPVHFNETDIAGRFWSLTRYEDIKRGRYRLEKFQLCAWHRAGFSRWRRATGGYAQHEHLYCHGPAHPRRSAQDCRWLCFTH